MRLGSRVKIDSEALSAKADALMDCAKSQPEVWARINEETELVLEVDIEKNSCGYYFVDHAQRIIFWAHAYTCDPSGEILFNVKAAKKHSHISGWFNVIQIAVEHSALEYSLEAQYWLVLSNGSVCSVNIFDQFC